MAFSEKKEQLNDIGVTFIVTVKDCVSGTATVLNIASSTARQIILKSPSGVSVTKTASLHTDGTDGKISYRTADGDLNEVGTWRLQAKISFGATYVYNSEIETFKVYENL